MMIPRKGREIVRSFGRYTAAALGSAVASGRSEAGGDFRPEGEDSYSPLVETLQELFTAAEPFLAIFGLIVLLAAPVVIWIAYEEAKQRRLIDEANRAGERVAGYKVKP